MECLKRYLKRRIQLRRPRIRKATLCLIDRKLTLSRIHHRNLRGKRKAMLLLLAYLAKKLIFDAMHNDPAPDALVAEKKTLVSMFSIKKEDAHVCETKGMVDSIRLDIRIHKSRR
ncbi:hypothetical protein TGAMA5MH_02575 [Trichoderma gamsii]|uniref:Uncharacterized protein n=1 Tax=Trichoderma gamsii TaxID=398673 RepID=A0A2K0TJZ4_9HYPO|nr:hypothetical protein TGAMA5MH_02575 [Trichoderma gamsii]